MNQLLSNQCHKLKEEVEKKDKIIDLMTNELYEEFYLTYEAIYGINNKEQLKQYFENKAKEILNK